MERPLHCRCQSGFSHRHRTHRSLRDHPIFRHAVRAQTWLLPDVLLVPLVYHSMAAHHAAPRQKLLEMDSLAHALLPNRKAAQVPQDELEQIRRHNHHRGIRATVQSSVSSIAQAAQVLF